MNIKSFIPLALIVLITCDSSTRNNNSVSQKPVPVPREKVLEFHEAIKSGNINQFRKMAADRRLLDAPDENGLTSLHIAIVHARLSMAQAIINAGADVNATTKYLETPLHLAVSRNKLFQFSPPFLAALLIRKGAKVNACDKNGVTPLHYAVWSLELVKMLVNNGADIHTKAYNMTPLQAAEMCLDRNEGVVRYLKGLMKAEAESL